MYGVSKQISAGVAFQIKEKGKKDKAAATPQIQRESRLNN